MSSSARSVATLHILVVEDAPEDFELIEGELQRTGLNFSAARIEAAEALPYREKAVCGAGAISV